MLRLKTNGNVKVIARVIQSESAMLQVPEQMLREVEKCERRKKGRKEFGGEKNQILLFTILCAGGALYP